VLQTYKRIFSYVVTCISGGDLINESAISTVARGVPTKYRKAERPVLSRLKAANSGQRAMELETYERRIDFAALDPPIPRRWRMTALLRVGDVRAKLS